MNAIRKFAIILVLFFPALLCAQTTVIGTIVDANSNPYANGTVSAYFLPNSGQGAPFTVNSTTNSVGLFSIVLKTAGAYQFTVCAMPVNIGPLANPTPSQVCAYSSPIQISGGSQDVSSQINAHAPLLGPKSGNTGGGNLPTATAVGDQISATGVGTNYTARSKSAIDPRDYGVDCTDSVDSTAAWTAAVTAAGNYGKIIVPEHCLFQLTGTPGFSLYKVYGLEIEFAGRQGNGCDNQGPNPSGIDYRQTYSSGNTVVSIIDSQRLLFKNLTIYTNGGADNGILIDQDLATPPITTRNDFYNPCIYNNTASRNASWKGINVSPVSASNVENIHFYHPDITCSQSAPLSSSSNGYGIVFGASVNEKNEIVDDYNTHNCSQDVVSLNGGDATFQFGLASNSYNNIGLGSFNDALYGFRSENATNAVSITNSIGPHLIYHNDFAGSAGTIIDCPSGCGALTLFSNQTDSAPGNWFNVHGGLGASGPLIGFNNRNFTYNTADFALGAFTLGAFHAINGTGHYGSFTFADWLIGPASPSGNALGSNTQSPAWIFESNYGTAVNKEDYILQTLPAGLLSNSATESTFIIGNNSTLTHWWAFQGQQSGLIIAKLSQPASPVVSFRGSSGAATCTYLAVAHGIIGTTQAGTTTTVANCPNNLTSTNWELVGVPSVGGAILYDIYRTAGGNCNGVACVAGKIGTIPAYAPLNGNGPTGTSTGGQFLIGGASILPFTDNGIQGDGSTAPLTNTTGAIKTGITGSTQCLHVDTNGLMSGTGSDCGAGGGGLSGLVTFGFLFAANPTTAVSTTPGTNQGTYTAVRNNTVHGTAAAVTEAQIGDCALPGTITGATTTYTLLYTDLLCNVSHDIAGSQSATITIPTPATLDNPLPIFTYSNYSTHDDTLTPTTYTISAGNVAAGANITAKAGFSCKIQLDPTNISTWKADCHQMATSVAVSFSGNTSVATSAGAGVNSAPVGNPIVADGSGNVIPQVGSTTVGVGGVNGWGLPIWENDSVGNGTPVNNTLYVHQVRIAGLPQTIGHATFNVVTGGTSETMYVCVYNVTGSTLLWSAAGAVNTSATVVSSTAAQVTLQPGYYLFAYGQTGTASAVVTADGSIGTTTWINVMNQNGVRVGTAANNASSGCPATTGALSVSTGAGAAMKFMLEP